MAAKLLRHQRSKYGQCGRFAATGSCKFGDACKYAHDAASNSKGHENNDPARNSSSKDRSEYEELLKRWRFSVPKDKKRMRPLGDLELATFIQNGRRLVDEDIDYMQTVVTTLASELGLYRVRELLERPWDTMEDEKLARVWKALLLPYLELLAHESIHQSTVVNVRYTTLLNDLYGAGGKQAVPVFKAVVRCLSFQLSEKVGLLTCTAVFANMLEKNDSAIVNPELQPIAEAFLALLAEGHVGRATERHIRTINAKLELGAAIPIATDDKGRSTAEVIVPTFTIAQDLPGALSAYGRRHDNDSADIQDIAVLPTMEEIQSTRLEYLPREDPKEWHLPGVKGLIDRHFRLVREDTVGQLRDAAKFELERLQEPEASAAQSKRYGARTHAYHNVVLDNVRFDEHKGVLFILSFDQPVALAGKSKADREAWWHDSMRLTSDSLICLLSSGGQANFLVVYSPGGSQWNNKKNKEKPVHEIYTLAKDEHRAQIIAQMTTSDPELAIDLIKGHTAMPMTPVRNALIEFPGVVLPAFGPTLSALKTMSGTLDIPFQDFLVPGEMKGASPPPAYAQKAGFEFDLSPLVADDDGANGAAGDIASALQRSTLDEAQREAVEHTLTNSLALIQGPPGTGKSYTGIKIVQALLQNKAAGKLGPILCVCFTNHALDQLLEHLVDAGIQQIVRIGSKSKSERLAAINLREVAMKEKFTKLEYEEHKKAQKSILGTGHQVKALLERLGVVLSNRDEAIMHYLKERHPEIHKQFDNEAVDDEGFQEVRYHRMPSPLLAWLAGGEWAHPNTHRSTDRLLSGEIFMSEITHGEREKLYVTWTNTVVTEIYEELRIQLEAYNEDKATIDSLRGDKNLRALLNANVIGVTTSGLARNLDYLRKLPTKILLVEEAGEVLEAHLLTAMLPSVEQAILIGDHQQLRPKVQNYELSVENPRSQIALDISLFERLVRPRAEAVQGLPFVTLETQRRMHPSISTLVRKTQYPNLQDAPSVHDYPEVTGLRHRLYWFDHDKKEDNKDDTTSHTNTWEADMVASLVRHLQRQGVYAASDIAVLTPYLAQLRLLRRKLNSFFDIILNDRDLEDLAGDGEGQASDEPERKPSIVKGSLLQALRLATCDNFQGEEAKTVVVSLVRSNDQKKCGFLRTPNRINVLLSRAQHGMYIIGNADTCSSIPMWQEVLDEFREKKIIGGTLELCCPRHPDKPLHVTAPEHFAHVAPEAGCDLMCGKQLPCGHACEVKCHAETLHNAVYCMKDCNRPKKGCQHVCRLACGADCEPQCNEVVDCNIGLSCGHSITSLPCWQYQDQSTIRCRVPVSRKVPGCGHSVTVACSVSVDGPGYLCREPCLASLEDCFHHCQNYCFNCREKNENGEIVKVKHPGCSTVCGKKYSTCEHSCKSKCHTGDDCPPCQEPCGVACVHSKCAKRCSEPCAPCTEEVCPSHCPHSACEYPCGAPCNWVPCSKRCDKKLGCGHQCPSLCGELCPGQKFCQLCASDDIRDSMVDMLEGASYGDIDLDVKPCMFLPCGHIFTFETLDGQMELSTQYEMREENEIMIPVSAKKELEPLSETRLRTCPNCRGSLRSVNRYGRVVRRRLLDETTKKFITWSNKKCFDLASRVQAQQEHLLDTRSQAKLQGDIKLDGKGSFSASFKRAAGNRFNTMLNLNRDLALLRARVRKDEQPFQRVRDMVEAVRRRQQESNAEAAALPAFNYDEATILQTRGQLLVGALSLRSELIMITDLIAIWEKTPVKERNNFSITIDFSQNRQRCDEMVLMAEKTKNVLQRVEGNVFWAQFVALEWTVMYANIRDGHTTQNTESFREQALGRLDQAQDICDEFPGTTASVVDEVNSVRQMLTDSISASEIRMVVTAMSGEFRGTGHWYRCLHGHLFSVGNCGMPMESTLCPQCGARIGGHNHQSVEGVTAATDVEQ